MNALLDFLDRLDDLVKIRPVAGIELGVEQFAIGANLEGPAARGNQRERLNALAELKNFGRQTDGFRRVVSNDAVFNRYLGFHRQSSFPRMKLSARFQTVKRCSGDSVDTDRWLIQRFWQSEGMTSPSERVQTDMNITEM